MNVLSLFDGMSCGRLALDKAGVQVDNYVASELKEDAINNTLAHYPDTIPAGDVTKLHYENGTLYKNCRRWAVINDISYLTEEQIRANADNINFEQNLLDIANLKVSSDFNKNNDMINNMLLGRGGKGEDGLLLATKSIKEDDVYDSYVERGFEMLPSGEVCKWELGEPIYVGFFDILIGGSPCQDFSIAKTISGRERNGLEGPKSRLFYDYLRIKNETRVPLFFLENVEMKAESYELLNGYLRVQGIFVESANFTCANRKRFYWTNLCTGEDFDKAYKEYIPQIKAEEDCRKYIIKTLPKYEQMIFEETKFIKNSEKNNKAIVKMIDALLTDEECDYIANANAWVKDELPGTFTNRDITNEIHLNLAEAQANVTQSRFYMRNVSCKNVSRVNKPKFGCLLTKQDRHSANIVDFGTLREVDLNGFAIKDDATVEDLMQGDNRWYRFLTKFELCKAQTVPYEYLRPLSFTKVGDVCGDGWTIDVVANFFRFLTHDYDYDHPYNYITPEIVPTDYKALNVVKDEPVIMVRDSINPAIISPLNGDVAINTSTVIINKEEKETMNENTKGIRLRKKDQTWAEYLAANEEALKDVNQKIEKLLEKKKQLMLNRDEAIKRKEAEDIELAKKMIPIAAIANEVGVNIAAIDKDALRAFLKAQAGQAITEDYLPVPETATTTAENAEEEEMAEEIA